MVDFKFLDALIAPEFTRSEDFLDKETIDLMVERFGNKYHSRHKEIWKNVWDHNIRILKAEIGKQPASFFRNELEFQFMKMVRSMILLNPEFKNYVKKARFTYAGIDSETSRHFCQVRVNRDWTRDQIFAWNDLDWPGKITAEYGATPEDIFINLGGFNCRHYLVPVGAGDE